MIPYFIGYFIILAVLIGWTLGVVVTTLGYRKQHKEYQALIRSCLDISKSQDEQIKKIAEALELLPPNHKGG